MRITPIDIEMKSFPMKFRGFHPEEVSGFLEQIREELEDLLRENAALKERISTADEQIHRFWETRELLSVTLQDAHQLSDEYRIHARREVEGLLEKAEEDVCDMVDEARARARQISDEIMELRIMRKKFEDEVKSVFSRFEAAVAGGGILRKIISSGENVTAVESGTKLEAVAAEEHSMIQEQPISVVEGHSGEEGCSEA